MGTNAEEEWISLMKLLKQVANESLGTKRKWHRKTGLRNWDENIKQIITDTREAYKKFLCTRKEEDKIDYHRKRAIAKREVRKYHMKNREEFVSYLENDITRPQPQIYKIIKNLSKEVKETVMVNIIPHETWLNYYPDLWSQSSETLQISQSDNFDTDTITLDELVTVLKNMKNNKAPGEDSINVELFKYSCQTFLIRFLNFLNTIWEGEEPPKSWMKSVVIPIFKKGN
jgi:hypothetical protein